MQKYILFPCEIYLNFQGVTIKLYFGFLLIKI